LPDLVHRQNDDDEDDYVSGSFTRFFLLLKH
jgi:hypothetical protein